MTARAEVERRVDELAEAHSGQAFALAIRSYAAEVDAPTRELLKRVLLERAADFDQAIMDRVDTRGWFRWQWDRATTSPPPGHERER